MKKVTKTDEWQKAVIDHIKLLQEDEKREFAHKIIFDVAFEVGINGYEMAGILEAVKYNLLEYLRDSKDKGCENCENKDCPDHPDNK
jgi:hypothetical protein